MNAKETLKKIAEALNIVESAQEEKVEAKKPVEVAETTESVKAEEKVEEAKEVAKVTEKVEEAKEVAKVTEKVAKAEEVKKVEAEKPSKEDERVRELESQLADLKKILEAAMTNDEKEVISEVKKQEPKGLTHSPEKEVKKKSGGIGSKGMSIQERVYKYMNN